MMKRPIRIISIVALLLLGISAWLWLRGGSGTESTPSKLAGASDKAITVDAAVLKEEQFSESLMVSGEVIPSEQVDIYPEVAGRVVGIDFTEGARVVTGQTLVRLYDADIRAQITKFRAQLELDSSHLARYEAMKKVDGVSVQDLDAARAQVQVRKAEIEQQLALLSKTNIKAPFTGTVGLRMISVGAVISSQTKVTTLADVTSLKVDVSVPDRYAYSVHRGSTFRCVAHTNKESDTVMATVFAEEPVVSQNTRSLKIRARLSNNATIVPGTVVDVLLNTSVIPNAIMIPSQAVQQGMNGASVFVVKNGIANETSVVLGGRTANKVHVLSGIAAGDTVAVNGLLVLKQGMKVNVKVN